MYKACAKFTSHTEGARTMALVAAAWAGNRLACPDMGVAANQAVIGLQQAQLQTEQTRVAQELDRKVRQRTKELGTANAELGRALKQIDSLRDDLQRENVVLREQAAGARGGLAPWQLRRAEALMSENLSVSIPLGQVAE